MYQRHFTISRTKHRLRTTSVRMMVLFRFSQPSQYDRVVYGKLNKAGVQQLNSCNLRSATGHILFIFNFQINQTTNGEFNRLNCNYKCCICIVVFRDLAGEVRINFGRNTTMIFINPNNTFREHFNSILKKSSGLPSVILLIALPLGKLKNEITCAKPFFHSS